MSSSLRQWESDPLFSAAEVVQDSADRMDSIFRLLLHEQSLVRENHSDAKLHKSIEYYRRDLATAVETAKWQLEDFEREVNLSATVDSSHARDNVISRHRQFVSAIRDQILDVENTLRDTSPGDLVKGTERVTLDEQDRNGLALFLSGEGASKHIPIQNFDDSNSMIRFLNPTASSNLDSEIVEHNSGEHLRMNGVTSMDKSFGFVENESREVRSHPSMSGNFGASCSLLEAVYDPNNKISCWDLEANETASRSFSNGSRSRGYNGGIKIFSSLRSLWYTYGSWASRSFTKRWKDGEEQRNSRHHALQGNCGQLSLSCIYIRLQALYSEFGRLVHSSRWISQPWARCGRSPYYAQAKGYSKLLIPAIILTLIVLGIVLL